LPTGFLYKIRLLSTWGDFDYIGLNGIEFYDHKGEPLLTKNSRDYKIAAEPSSVNKIHIFLLLMFLGELFAKS